MKLFCQVNFGEFGKTEIKVTILNESGESHKKGKIWEYSDAAESDISVRAARKTVGLKCRRRRHLNKSAIHKHVTESPNLESCVAIYSSTLG